MIVVLDELDKLTNQPRGTQVVRDLLMGLKNLLTTSGAHFVFVAGPDLHDEALDDRMQGSGVFESVFADQVYVPCIWNAEARLLEVMIPDAEARRLPQVAALRDYLAFWGRGKPGSLLRAFESFVRWNGEQPYLHLDDSAMAEIEFYARLERVTQAFIEDRVDTSLRMLDIDRWRIAVHHAVEWILNSRATFSVDELVKYSSEAKVAPLLDLEEEELQELLGCLARGLFIRQVGVGLAEHPYYQDASQPTVYEVSDTAEKAIREFRGAEAPNADVISVAALDAPAFAGAVGQTLNEGRYVLLEELDRTGTGHVYRAQDTRTDMDVAVKVFDLPSLRNDERMRARFLRETAIANEVDHPRIVRTHNSFGEPDGRLAIVMELVQGRSLRQELRAVGTLTPVTAVRLACELLDALSYLEKKGIARLDLRPSTIMLDQAFRPTIVNLGLAKHAGVDADDDMTRVGMVVGTPAYAAPEQLAGEPVDIRADLFGLALIIFEAITGLRARLGESVAAVMQYARNADVDLSALPGSPSLREALRKALERDRNLRFQSPAQMLERLAATPEHQI